MKKILVHCCTNRGTSNFGDVLFAEMILKRYTEKGYEVSFYELSPYLTEYLYKTRGLPEYHFSVKDADAVVYFAGGYFGERKKTKIVLRVIHFRRFMPAAIKAMLHRKKVAIAGIGAGDYLWPPSRNTVKRFCNKASLITTRDIESTEYLKSIGVTSSINTCSDVAQTFRELHEDWVSDTVDGGKLFLHVDNNVTVTKKILGGIADLVKEHENVKVIVGAGYCVPNDAAYGAAYEALGGDRVERFVYSTPEQLIGVLSSCNTVITYALHVGIISAACGCSVIAVSKHEKIPRYYRQIGEAGRCLDFDKCSPNEIGEKLSEYWNKPIVLDDGIMTEARKNWVLLDEFIEKL